MTPITRELIQELTQSVLAVLIVVGAGILLLTGNTRTDLTIPLVTLVLGFYFGKVAQSAINANATKPKE